MELQKNTWIIHEVVLISLTINQTNNLNIKIIYLSHMMVTKLIITLFVYLLFNEM